MERNRMGTSATPLAARQSPPPPPPGFFPEPVAAQAAGAGSAGAGGPLPPPPPAGFVAEAKGLQPGQSGEKFLRDRQSGNAEGVFGAVGDDISGAASGAVKAISHPIDTLKGMVKSFAQTPDRYRQRVAEGRSPAYSAIASGAEDVLPVNVRGMEEAADRGDTGAILGHAGTGLAASLGPSAVKEGVPSLARRVAAEHPVIRGVMRDVANKYVGRTLADRILPEVETPQTLGERVQAARDEMYNDLGDRRVQRGKEQGALDAAHAQRLSDQVKTRQKELADQERLKDQDARAKNSRENPPAPGSAENPGLHSNIPTGRNSMPKPAPAPSGMSVQVPERNVAGIPSRAANPLQDLAERQRLAEQVKQATVERAAAEKLPPSALDKAGMTGPSGKRLIVTPEEDQAEKLIDQIARQRARQAGMRDAGRIRVKDTNR